MSVVKNKSTAEGRAYWDHLERLASQVKANPSRYTGVPSHPSVACCHVARPDTRSSPPHTLDKSLL